MKILVKKRKEIWQVMCFFMFWWSNKLYDNNQIGNLLHILKVLKNNKSQVGHKLQQLESKKRQREYMDISSLADCTSQLPTAVKSQRLFLCTHATVQQSLYGECLVPDICLHHPSDITWILLIWSKGKTQICTSENWVSFLTSVLPSCK